MMKQKLCLLHFLHGALLLAVSLFLSGCQFTPDRDYTTTKPNAAGLVGIWEPTLESLNDMRTKGGYKISRHQLILSANGTFSMLNMPDCIFGGWDMDWDKSRKRFKSGTGKWRIIHSEYAGRKIWDVEFNLSTGGIGALPTNPEPVLIGQTPPYVLRFSFGDTDAGNAINFQKRDM